MFFSRMKTPQLHRITVNRFGGLDLRDRPAENCPAAMENLCSDGEGALRTRPKRSVVTQLAQPGGVTDKETLIWVDGHTLYVGGVAVGAVLTAGEKQFVSMGAYLLVFPDKLWVNLRDLSRFGSMENTVTTQSEVQISLCRSDGTAWEDYLAAETPPAAPEEEPLWLDLSGSEPVLRQYSEGGWAAAADVYTMLRCAGIGVGFAAGDGVELFGCEQETLNGLHVLSVAQDDAIVIGVTAAGDSTQTAAVTVRRSVPDMDFVTECGNRLWGCKYGLVNGRAVNEIYASKLGDFTNWQCYQGLSTDSYAASRGSDGPFTAAASYLGTVLFFKDRCIERLYPSATGAHQVVTMACPGAAAGSHGSVCAVDGTLLYLGRDGVYAFDGSMPVVMSRSLGHLRLHGGVAGALEGKYWLSAADEEGKQHLLVYDSRRSVWHREDDLSVLGFAVWDGSLCALAADGTLYDLQGRHGTPEGEVAWMARSAPIGLESPWHKYPIRLSLRLRPAEGATVEAALSYDDGRTWETGGTVTGRGLAQAVTLHLRPRRCAQTMLRLQGRGECVVYAVSAVYEKGSDET